MSRLRKQQCETFLQRTFPLHTCGCPLSPETSYRSSFVGAHPMAGDTCGMPEPSYFARDFGTLLHDADGRCATGPGIPTLRSRGNESLVVICARHLAVGRLEFSRAFTQRLGDTISLGNLFRLGEEENPQHFGLQRQARSASCWQPWLQASPPIGGQQGLAFRHASAL